MSEQQTDGLTVHIDGQELKAEPGSSIIEVADKAGIHIPRFCYHKKLSVAANCRMCLVDVEGARKPSPACATPIMDGMVVETKSEKALSYQKAVMEFLLINHPLDCPICDQGGECELQDVAMGYGKGVSRYTERKRVVKDKNIGPLISTDMTRCILCTRCVRFGEEVAGQRELGAVGRGEHTQITTFLEKNVDSPMSGNVIDLCPVGALTSKPYRFTARPWEVRAQKGIAPHDCVGSNIEMHTLRGQAMRVVPSENEKVNETWLSDRDRFSYEGIHSENRLTTPMIKKNGEWETVDWQTALNYVVDKVTKVVKDNGVEQLGALISPSATTEEMYLLQKMLRALGSNNIDHRLRQQDFSHQTQQAANPKMDAKIADVEHAKQILIVGSDLLHAQPILHHRVRKAALKGASVISINPAKFEMNMTMATEVVVDINDIVQTLAEVAAALISKAEQLVSEDVTNLLQKITPSEEAAKIAADLQSEETMIFAGDLVINHPEASAMLSLIQFIQSQTNAKLGVLSEGANATGAWLAGALPHRQAANKRSQKKGFNAAEMLSVSRSVKGYFLFNVEPELDSAFGAQAEKAIKAADMVVAMTSFETKALKSYANVLLPIGTFAETSGTYVNIEGQWQSFMGAVKSSEEVKPGWKVLRVLANFFDLEGFDYTSSVEVLNELKSALVQMNDNDDKIKLPKRLPEKQKELVRAASVPMYSVDPLVRQAISLQQTQAGQNVAVVFLSQTLADKLDLKTGDNAEVKQGEFRVKLPVEIHAGLADQTVFVPMGVTETVGLDDAFGPIEVNRA